MANVSFVTANETLYAYLAGEIDHDSAQQLRLEIDSELSVRMPQTLIMDFGGVGFMDSSGVGLILGRQRRLSVLGGTLCIQHAPTQIRKVLQLAHIENREA